MTSCSTKQFQVLLEVHKELEAKKSAKNSKANSEDRGDEAADPGDTASVATTDTAVSVEVAGAAALAE